MVLSNVHFYFSCIMGVPESWLVFCKSCFDTPVAPQRNVRVPLRKHSFACKHAALISVFFLTVKCDLPIAIKNIYYLSWFC